MKIIYGGDLNMGSRKGIWNEINENFVDDDRLMKGVLTKWEKEMVNLKHPKDQEASRDTHSTTRIGQSAMGKNNYH